MYYTPPTVILSPQQMEQSLCLSLCLCLCLSLSLSFGGENK